MSHCLVAMSVCRDTGPVPRNALSRMFDIPDAYLSKQLHLFVKAGIIRSAVGKSGGYTLQRPAQSITLLDVFDVVQGDSPMFECEEIRCRGIFAADAEKIRESGICGIHKAMVEAEANWRKSLHSVTMLGLSENIDSAGKNQMRTFVTGRGWEAEEA